MFRVFTHAKAGFDNEFVSASIYTEVPLPVWRDLLNQSDSYKY